MSNDEDLKNEEIDLTNISYFTKENKANKVWWLKKFVKIGENTYAPEHIGEHLFSFDKNKVYNLFRDYPYKLTKEEKEIFDKENPYWANFLKNRN